MTKLSYLLVISSITLNSFGQKNLADETKVFVTFQRGTYLLQNLTLVDGTGGVAKTDQDIIIVNDIIDKVGADLPVPAGPEMTISGSLHHQSFLAAP